MVHGRECKQFVGRRIRKTGAKYVECGLQAVAVAATSGRHAIPVLALLDQETSALAHAAKVAVEQLCECTTPSGIGGKQGSRTLLSNRLRAGKQRALSGQQTDQLKAMRRLAWRPK
jgi:hypothetical protein